MKENSIVLGIGFTNACNMGCNFCYSKDNRLYSYRQPLDIWKTFFKNNGKYIQSINYGTGENALEDDWFRLIDYISYEFPNIIQAVTTNGSLAHILKTDSKKEEIFLRAIKEVDVSLDYNNKILHNNIRNNKFAYDWAIETIEYCNEHNIKLTIVTIGLDDTLKIKNISEIFKLAHKYNAINRINIYRKAADRNDECELSYDVLMEFLEWASKKQTVMDLMDPLFNSIAGGEDIVVDASGTNSYRIVSDGRIYPSTYLLTDDFLLGNINDKDFYFDNVTIKQFRDNILTPDYCKKCEFSNKCK